MDKTDIVRVRFPNESYYDEIKNFKLEEFQPTNIFDFEVFGKWGDIHVAIMREDYDRLRESDN